MRTTKQRTEIANLLDTVDEFLTAQEIHALLQDRGSKIGLATVYRNLASLTERAQVDAVTGTTGETRYRSCSTQHHHHLTCVECGRTVELALKDIEAICANVAKRHGFTNLRHTVELSGTCRDCR
jgi:Fur family ferric uptake transcriptional regulator